MGTLKKTEWTEKKIQDKLKLHFLTPSAKKYEITNLYVFDWESDYLAITKSGIFHEIEIKISRADFKNDFKNKEKKHLILESPRLFMTAPKPTSLPNYFYYAVPEGLVKEDEIPEYAGLIYVQPWGIRIVKDAKKLHDEKLDLNKLKICDKFYYSMVNWQNKYNMLSDADATIKELKKQIKDYNKAIMYYDDQLSQLNCELYEANLKIKKYEEENERRNIETSQRAL